MDINILIISIGSILSGIFYRMGGSDKYNPKWRDWGCSIVTLGCLTINWTSILCFLLMWGALSTYWKCLNKFFGKSKDDCYWFNWLAHGLGVGLALLPYYFYSSDYVRIIIRAVVLGLLMMMWSEENDNAVVEEFGRGFVIVATLPILTIGG